MPRNRIEYERQPCRICRSVTTHKVIISAGGRHVASKARCLHHEEWTNGRIDVLGPDGEWKTVIEGAS